MKNFLFILFLASSFGFSQKELTHEVYFETDKYKVLDTEQNRLLLYLIKLQEVDIEKIEIYGFCDDRGSDSYNLELSQQRADAIKALLSDNEIDEAIISHVDGKGEILLKVIDSKDADILRGLNRKVEIIATLRTKEEIEIKKVISKKAPKEPSTIAKLKGDLNIGDKIHFKDVLFKTNAWPNPSAEEFNISINTVSSEPIDVSVSTLSGRMVSKFTVNAGDSLNFGKEYVPGLYIVNVTQGDNIENFKLIKR